MDNDWEQKEAMVLLDLGPEQGLVNASQIEVNGLDTSIPRLNIGSTVFQGQVNDCIGTMFVLNGILKLKQKREIQ